MGKEKTAGGNSIPESKTPYRGQKVKPNWTKCAPKKKKSLKPPGRGVERVPAVLSYEKDKEFKIVREKKTGRKKPKTGELVGRAKNVAVYSCPKNTVWGFGSGVLMKTRFSGKT